MFANVGPNPMQKSSNFSWCLCFCLCGFSSLFVHASDKCVHLCTHIQVEIILGEMLLLLLLLLWISYTLDFERLLVVMSNFMCTLYCSIAFGIFFIIIIICAFVFSNFDVCFWFILMSEKNGFRIQFNWRMEWKLLVLLSVGFRARHQTTILKPLSCLQILMCIVYWLQAILLLIFSIHFCFCLPIFSI